MLACMNHLAAMRVSHGGRGTRRPREGKQKEDGDGDGMLLLLSLREMEDVGFNNPLRVIGLDPRDVLRSFGGDSALAFECGQFVQKQPFSSSLRTLFV